MKLELYIPSTLKEIPLKNYQRFMKLAQNSNDEEFVSQKMIEIFCGIELKQVVKIGYNDLVELVAHFKKLFDSKPKFEHRFTLGGVEFGFIPDFENISYGEYIDLERYIQDVNTYHNAMAIMFRPITKRRGDKYEIEEYTSSVTYCEVMENAPLEIMLGAVLFFSTLESELLTASLHYLEKVTEKLTSSAKNTSLQNSGVGTALYMRYLKATSQGLKPLPDFRLDNVLRT